MGCVIDLVNGFRRGIRWRGLGVEEYAQVAAKGIIDLSNAFWQFIPLLHGADE